MRRRILPVALATLLLAALGWSAVWWLAAGRYKRDAEAWIAARRAAGLTVAYDGLAVRGFPLRWRLVVTRPGVADPSAPLPWRWRGPDVAVDLSPLAPQEATLRAPGRHRLDYGGVPERATLDAENLTVRLTVAPSGRLRWARLDAGGLSLVASAGAAAVRLAGLTAAAEPPPPEPPAARPEGRPPVEAALTLALRGLDLPAAVAPGMPRRLERAEARARWYGALGDGSPAAALEAWRAAGGVVEVERLSLQWGTLTLHGEGTVALDAALQPLAALSVRVRGYAAALEALVNAGTVRPQAALVARLALTLLEREDGAAFPVTLQNRIVTAGPAPLMRIGRVVWPGEAPAAPR